MFLFKTNMMCSGGSGGTIMRTTDLQKWTRITSGTDKSQWTGAYISSNAYEVGGSGRVLFAVTWLTWTYYSGSMPMILA
jgi:hypothetical protein